MAKFAEAGRVKTRLGREIGVARATCFYRHMVGALLARLVRDRRFQTVLAVAPDRAVGAPVWPRGMTQVGQGEGDLGARMQRLLSPRGPGPVILIGTDIPAVNREIIAKAFRCLGDADVVFGPADDGGFWLVGYRRSRAVTRAFDGVGWSRSTTLTEALGRVGGMRVALAETHSDIDTAEDFRALGALAGRCVLPVRSSGCS